MEIKKINFKTIEKKWQKKWEEKKAFKVKEDKIALMSIFKAFKEAFYSVKDYKAFLKR